MIIDGKAIAQKIKNQIREQVEKIKNEKNITPGLATLLVGENPASQVYIKSKNSSCIEVGMNSFHQTLAATTTQNQLLELIDQLNNDPKVHGILVQLPLPQHIDAQKVIERISPLKDVDGFHPINMGNLVIGRPGLKPCTPFGVMKLLEETGFDPSGKNAVVIGRSNIVGKPMALLLLGANATVTICHSKTKSIDAVIKNADLVVAAVGIPHYVKGEWIKEGAVVIDVGINRLPSGKLAGDVDFEAAKNKASYITPVPGGVGPMTIAMLLWNTLEAFKHVTT